MNDYISEIKYEEIKQAAIDWQYIVVDGGGMACKSDCEEWLIKRFSIDAFTARHITNSISEGPRYFICGGDGVTWLQSIANRSAPKWEQYPDITFEVLRGPKGD